MTQRRDTVFFDRFENEPGDQAPSANQRKAKIFALLSEIMFLQEEDTLL